MGQGRKKKKHKEVEGDKKEGKLSTYHIKVPILVSEKTLSGDVFYQQGVLRKEHEVNPGGD